jgi:hypothetical protein
MADAQPAVRSAPLWLTLEDRVNCHIPGQQAIAATLARISEEGAWVRGAVELQVATFLTVEWRNLANKALHLPGQIVHKKQETDAVVSYYGVRFQNLGNADKDALVGKILEVDRRNKARPERESSISKQVASHLNTKRAAFRANVSFDALYAKPGQSAHRLGKASNLSTGGMRLATIEHFEDGTELNLTLSLPDDFMRSAKAGKDGVKTIHGIPVREFEKMNLRSKVVKAFREEGNPRWIYGIAFIDPSPHDVEELRRFIHISQLRELAQRSGNA